MNGDDQISSPERTLLLIMASSPEIRHVRRMRVLNFQQITMPYLAAFVPPSWKVIHVDESVSPVDVTLKVDLVGITFHTPSAYHVYDLAAQFRKQGIPVVLGGPHVTLLPDEAQAHADVIFVGEAELSWPQFLEQFDQGKYARRYCSDALPTLEDMPMARKELYLRHDLSGEDCLLQEGVLTIVTSVRWFRCIDATFVNVQWHQ